MPRVVLHIDRLVLHGVPAAERDALVRQFEAALVREFAAPGVADAWVAGGHRAQRRARFAAQATTLGDAAARALVASPERSGA